jgi:hypothetical protein
LKIKNPSQNVRKVGKPMQGKASVFAPPGGAPFYPHYAPAWERKNLYFQPFYPGSATRFCVVFAPKNMRFMTDFLPPHFINKNQKTALPANGGPGQSRLGQIKPNVLLKSF